MAGYPFQDVKDLKVDEPEWKGLSDLEVRRLRAYAEQLMQTQTRSDQVPRRNYAILRVLLDAGLRAFELAELELDLYQSGSLVNISLLGDFDFRDEYLGQ